MQKRAIEKYIPNALKAVEEYLLKDEKNKVVQKEHKGYIAALGTAIITAGLLPALAFYTDVHHNKTNRHKVLEAIHFILNDGKTDGVNETSLLKKAIDEVNEKVNKKGLWVKKYDGLKKRTMRLTLDKCV